MARTTATDSWYPECSQDIERGYINNITPDADMADGYSTPPRITRIPTTPPRLIRQRAVLVDNAPLVLQALCINAISPSFYDVITNILNGLLSNSESENRRYMLYLSETYCTQFERHYEHMNYTIRFMDVILSMIIENNEDVINYYSDLIRCYPISDTTFDINQHIQGIVARNPPINDIEEHDRYVDVLDKVTIVSNIAIDFLRQGNYDFLFVPDFPRHNYGIDDGGESIPEIITRVLPVEELVTLFRYSSEILETRNN